MPDRRMRRRKTALMEVVEFKHNGKPIEDIMVDAFHQHGTEREAAQTLGVTQQTFTQWKYRLGLEHIIYRSAADDTNNHDQSGAEGQHNDRHQ